VKKCESDRHGRELVSTEGQWKGRLCFPVGFLVISTGISTGISADRIDKSPHAAAWRSIFTRKNSILSDLKFKETCAVRRFPFAPRFDAVA